MLITIITTLMLMLAYFLILYAGVGFIQDKRFFGSAHKDILAVVPDRKERFKGAHTIGWIILVFAFLQADVKTCCNFDIVSGFLLSL